MNYKSITTSTYIDKGLEVLKLAKSVNSKDELREKLILNQNSDVSRKNCWSQISKRYIKYNDNMIDKNYLVNLINNRDMKLNKELMYFSYLHAEPLAKDTILKYIYPRLQSESSYQLKREDIYFYIKDIIGCSESTLKKTAGCIVKALIDFGLINQENNAADIKYYKPSLNSFIYGLYAEYSSGFKEAQRYNILNPSVSHIRSKANFYRLFLMNSVTVESYLKSAWRKGLLNYEPRGGLNQFVLKDESLDKFVQNIVKR